MWAYAWLETLGQDLRMATRSIKKSPGFLAVVILSLALGIGANSTIFSVIDNLLYRPLPYDHPEQLTTIWETQLSQPDSGQPPPIAESLDWKKQNHVFQDIALTSFNEEGLLSGTGQPEHIVVQDVTPNFFGLLGVKPILGRISFPSEMQNHDQTVVIGYSFWKNHFNKDPNVLGKTFQLGRRSDAGRFRAVLRRKGRYLAAGESREQALRRPLRPLVDANCSPQTFDNSGSSPG
jgi:MacB-like periplasmic core domain